MRRPAKTLKIKSFPALERLESRVAMAGDVTIEIDRAGNLSVIGDARSNQIAVQQLEGGVFLIAGLDGERLRTPGGQFTREPVRASNVTGGVLVSTSDGNDTVEIRGMSADSPFAGFLTILTGSGSDTVTAKNLRTGGREFPLSPVAPAELDRLAGQMGLEAYRNALATGSATIVAGISDSSTHADSIQLENTRMLGPTLIHTGFGNDAISLEGTQTRQVRVDMAEGADRIDLARLARTSVFSIEAAMGPGNDTVTIGKGLLALEALTSTTFWGGTGTNRFEGVNRIAPGSLGTLTDPVTTGFQAVSFTAQPLAQPAHPAGNPFAETTKSVALPALKRGNGKAGKFIGYRGNRLASRN